jgi:CheY-like chemotaxis protein
MGTSEQGAREVLLVEADPALRRVMALGLRRRGLAVREARSLGEAWEAVAEPPAVVVLDVGLDAGSEWMLARTLRAHRLLARVPLLIVAWDCPIDGGAPDDDAIRWLCLTKPFDARALHEAVAGLLAAPVAVAVAPGDGAAVPATAPQGGAPGATAGDSAHPAGGAVSAASGAARDPRQAPAPSVWPLVTAGGATLALAGFLLHPALVVAGLAICFVAILWWGSERFEPASGL